jgi:hypothetical protein
MNLSISEVTSPRQKPPYTVGIPLAILGSKLTLLAVILMSICRQTRYFYVKMTTNNVSLLAGYNLYDPTKAKNNVTINFIHTFIMHRRWSSGLKRLSMQLQNYYLMICV